MSAPVSLLCFPYFSFNPDDRIFVMKTARTLLLAAPLLLAGCGEGYDLVKTDTMFPYGNQRTAGSGYAYVLAKMLPAMQEPILKPVEPRPAPQPEPATAPIEETKQIMQNVPAPDEAPAQDAEEIFREQQSK